MQKEDEKDTCTWVFQITHNSSLDKEELKINKAYACNFFFKKSSSCDFQKNGIQLKEQWIQRALIVDTTRSARLCRLRLFQTWQRLTLPRNGTHINQKMEFVTEIQVSKIETVP